MDTLMPSRVEVTQLQRLRQLRVDQARSRCQQADAALLAAQQALAQRQASIAALRAGLAGLADACCGAAFAQLPRWGETLRAHRAALADRLEREDLARLDDEDACERAAAQRDNSRRALARARGREDAMHDVVRQVRRAQAWREEQQAERERDSPAGPARGFAGGRP